MSSMNRLVPGQVLNSPLLARKCTLLSLEELQKRGVTCVPGPGVVGFRFCDEIRLIQSLEKALAQGRNPEFYRAIYPKKSVQVFQLDTKEAFL